MSSENEVLEPEVMDEVEKLERSFDKELRQEVLERDLYRCQICGSDQNLQVAHIPSGYDDGRPGKTKKMDKGHRGMGGKKSVNRPENLITLCEKHHSKLDGEGKFIKIERWVPSDHENGLIVLNHHMRKVDKDEIYFYSIPPKEIIKEAHQTHEKLMDSIDEMLDNFHSSLELLYWLKEDELYRGIPSSQSNKDFYESFKDYYLSEVKPKFGTQLSLNSVYSYHSALKPLIKRVDDPRERHQIKRGNLPALGSILNSPHIDEEKKDKAIDVAKGEQSEFKKFKRDLEIEENNATRVRTCKDCMYPNKLRYVNLEASDGTPVKFGSRRGDYCSVGEYYIPSLDHVKAEKIAKDCSKFDPKD